MQWHNREVLRQLERARVNPPEPVPAGIMCEDCGELYVGDVYYVTYEGDVVCADCWDGYAREMYVQYEKIAGDGYGG